MKSGKTFSIFGTLFVAACGAATNEKFTTGSGNVFEKSKEELKEDQHCTVSKMTGCSDIYAAGTAVSGSLTLLNLYTTCTAGENAYDIKITNSTSGSSNATFDTTISFYKVKKPKGSYICVGPEYETVKNELTLKEGFCSLNAVIHKTSYATDPNLNCQITITNSNPLKGTIDCLQLAGSDFYLSINTPSTFMCQE